MELDRLLHSGLSLFLRPARRHTTRNIRGICRKPGFSLLYNNQIFHLFSPACRRILLRVPIASSSPECPATVTNPGFAGCLNCLWLPRIRTWYQPSASSNRMTSLIFMDGTHLHTPRCITSRLSRAGTASAGAACYVLDSKSCLSRKSSQKRMASFAMSMNKRNPCSMLKICTFVRISYATSSISTPDLLSANNLRESRSTLNEVLEDRRMVYPIRDTRIVCCIRIGSTPVQHSMLGGIVYVSQQPHSQGLRPYPIIEFFRCLVVVPLLQISANVEMIDPVFKMECGHREI